MWMSDGKNIVNRKKCLKLNEKEIFRKKNVEMEKYSIINQILLNSVNDDEKSKSYIYIVSNYNIYSEYHFFILVLNVYQFSISILKHRISYFSKLLKVGIVKFLCWQKLILVL